MSDILTNPHGEPGAPTCPDDASDEVFTLANVITFVRLCAAPAFLALIFMGHDAAAAVVFALAAGTDFLDGCIARKTHTVSKLGQLLDPAVDRVLMATAVVGLLLVGRLPLWIVVLVLARDAVLLIGGAFILKRYCVRVPVVFLGKFATTCLFTGFAGLILNWPQIAGWGIASVAWLPGLNSQACSWGIWAVYVGLIIGACTTVYYLLAAARGVSRARGVGA